MTLPISATNVVRFVPSAFQAPARAAAAEAGETDLARFDDPPTYLINVPTPMTRAAYSRELVASGIYYPNDAQMMAALREEVAAALEPDDPDRARMLEQIDLFVALGAEGGEELVAAIRRMEIAVRQSSRAYAGLLGARAYFIDMAPLVAAQVFLRGRENPDRIFRRRAGLVTDEELATIPRAELAEVCARIRELLNLSPAQEKNSAGPSPSPGGPTTMPEASALPTAAPDGTSSERPSPAIPASP